MALMYVVFISPIITMLIGAATATYLERRWWRGEMIERGHAKYDFYDGKWYWNEQIPARTDPIARKVATQQQETKRGLT